MGEGSASSRSAPFSADISPRGRPGVSLARSRHFPLWDLPAALDVVGELAGVREPRRLAWGARALLAARDAFPCLVSFDPAETWRRFLALLE